MAIEQKTILLVEDEAIIAATEKTVLEENGYQVLVTDSGEKAINAVHKNGSIDLVLMDIDLGPGKMDGAAAAEGILRLRDLPVVFCTSHEEQETVNKVQGIARYGYVLKYTGEFVLLESINMAFELFNAHQRLKNENKERELVEQSRQGQLKNIRFLAETAVQFIDTAVNRDMYTYIGECLYSLTPDSYITVNSVNQERGILTTEALLGVGDRYEKLTALLGINPVGNTYTMNSSLLDLATGKLEKFTGGLHELTFRGIPKTIGSTIEKIFQIGSIYGIAFVVDREIYATATFLLKNGNEIQNSETIEAFVRQASIALKRQKIEDDLRKSRQQLQDLLTEKELLLKETHHRIKNNMNTTHSLLSIQAHSLEDKTSRDIITDAARRLQIMMVLYEQLYHSENYSELNARDFIPPLVGRIRSIFPPIPRVTFDVKVDNVFLSPKVLSPLGIIINELVTNSMKYAFNDVEEGYIGLHVLNTDLKMHLIYEDNGPGLPESITVKDTHGLGLKLVDSLVHQLDGTLQTESDRNGKGVRFTITCNIQ
ncbi:histidine kinase dimerization/phosphoacceptor domain -containing protein [Marispirochaeta sp.]|uniref:histidine kinase dimerization/phosphoacceptor domain -containing protein n=1 Tax=Marispirochaeta sp. TaxID=2038653 RepID=UPI0029C89704|nr:histidine kinase dimerization/phosphoacceptor domain -containing protein [Marispirochaeta sp.]